MHTFCISLFLFSKPCPLNNQCLTFNKIYSATLTSNKATKQYVGSTGNSFKDRYRNHKTSVNNINKRNTTELAKYIWDLKKVTIQILR